MPGSLHNPQATGTQSGHGIPGPKARVPAAGGSQPQLPPHPQSPPRRRHPRPLAPAAAPVTFVPATPAHTDACMAIQHAVYPPELWEERAVIASILQHGCSFVALQGSHGHFIGYLLIHTVPDPLSPPSLNHPLPPHPVSHAASHPPAPAHLFFHDLCLLASHHGGGLGGRLAQHALTHLAPRAASVSCVALPGALGFWKRQGFAAHSAWLPHERAKEALASYPEGSQLLVLAGRHGGGGQ